jgi:hypothetical protein
MTRKRRGRPAGAHHRSGFEAAIRKDLDSRGVKYQYEPTKYALRLDVPNVQCVACFSRRVAKTVRYTPDFFFPNGSIVEAKGKFTARDRKIALAFVQQYPYKYRMLFQRDNKLGPKSPTRYSGWCNANGIEYAVGTVVPKEWLK